MDKCHKGDDQVVVDCSVNINRKVEDQTVVDNCQISKMKIGLVESVNGSFPRYSVETVRRTHVVIRYCYWSLTSYLYK